VLTMWSSRMVYYSSSEMVWTRVCSTFGPRIGAASSQTPLFTRRRIPARENAGIGYGWAMGRAGIIRAH